MNKTNNFKNQWMYIATSHGGELEELGVQSNQINPRGHLSYDIDVFIAL